MFSIRRRLRALGNLDTDVRPTEEAMALYRLDDDNNRLATHGGRNTRG